MLFKGDKTCTPSQEKFVNFLIETREKQEFILEYQIKEINSQILKLEKRRYSLCIQKNRITKIIEMLKECRFLYYLRSGK